MLIPFRTDLAGKSQGWVRRMSFLFVGLLLWQCFEVLDGYWWDETFAIVHGTLIAVMLTEILLPVPRILRLLFQGVLVVGINVVVTKFRWTPLDSVSFSGDTSWWDGLIYNFNQLHPYFWISMMVWVAYQGMSNWAATRQQIITLTAMILTVLLIADSFTPLPLWDNIAWSIFLGLIWLVADHFTQFQSKHPDSWNHLRSYPVSILVPTLLIIAIVMSSGLFVPSIAPILKDPYTVWMESRGHSVPSFVGDKGSPNPSVKTRDSRSGYSRQDESLGGGFDFDYSTVMEITTNRRSYWRGETKSFYSGDGWRKTSAERREPSLIGLSKEQLLPLENGADGSKGRIEVTQTVKMVRKDPFPVLFGAAPIQQIKSIGYGEDRERLPGRLSWHSLSWELRWPEEDPDTPYPETYTLVSSLPVLDEEGLNKAEAILGNAQLNQMYLQVPEGLPNRVRELTLQITADARTPYEKMRSLEDYLKTNFTYTNTPDITKRKSADFVDAFLFEVMEGYCDYYSSALAVMGRVIGVPTRWVKGYAPGVLPLDQMMYQQPFTVDPTGSGTYTVRNADAHSWVEAYFQGYGWIPFEPTAGFTFPYAQAESDTQQQLDIPETTPDVETVQLEEETANSNWVGYTGLAILAGLAVFAIYRRRQIIDSLIRYRFRRFTPSQRIAWETERLLRYGKRKGLPFSEHDTARESLSAWIDRRALLEQELTEVLRQFEQAKYSGIPASEGEMKQFIALIKTVRERI